ncbi:MAG: type II toxin-antitoxin system HicA family toxin [Nitrospirae bacterium]|nr:type II toxin-antitoxin system HicA family toxin [Nitrospirota bacterium]
MGALGEIKARRLLRVLERAGFQVKRSRGSHRFLKHSDGRALLFAFHDRETIGPRMLSKVLKDAGLEVEDFERSK